MTEATIYLAGPVAAYDDGGAGWRERVVDEFSDEYEFRNPLDKYNVPVENLDVVNGYADEEANGTVGVRDIVEGDKEMLREADGLLVGYTDVQSVGTPMEVMWAHERGFPVALWVRDDTDFEALSPWYRYHTTSLTSDPELGLRHIAGAAADPSQLQYDHPAPHPDGCECSWCAEAGSDD